MKRINRFILCFVLSLFIFLTACDSKPSYDIDECYNDVMSIWQKKEYIGLSTENKPLEKHNLDIYYGMPYEVISDYIGNYSEYSIFTDFDRDVKFTIIRRVYESSKKMGTGIEYKMKEVYSEINRLSYFISYNFTYGKNSVKDTISLDDVYDNESGYGYIVYDWYLTEVDDSKLKMYYVDTYYDYAKAISSYRFSDIKSTNYLYYTVDDNLITFKVEKEEYYC